jgi:Starch-binding associating with outer membrane
MYHIKKITSIVLLFLAGIFLITSCETIDMDLKDNPNGLPPEKANVDHYLNGIQLDFAKNMQAYGRTSMEVTRITNMFGRSYQNAYAPATLDTRWEDSYAILKNIQLMNVIASEKGLKYHIGIGQVIEAYTIVNLVDYFGDVPYREALAGNTNLNPKVDPGAQVYADAIVLLDKAIANFSGTTNISGGFNDFYYNNGANPIATSDKFPKDKWINLANTIKMKIYIQTRLVDPTALAKFDALVTADKYIKTADGDFQWDYGTNVNSPDSRSPLYADNYLTTGTADYQSNWFMNLMLTDKATQDPRLRFYFYRQVSTSDGVDPSVLKCSNEPEPQHYIDGNFIYCKVDSGYWGRDHGDNFGTPPDSKLKTAYGVYPAGGRFDDSSFKAVSNTSGAKGNGITPIVLASTVDFWRAEAALNGGTGDAKALLLSGIQKSFTKVRTFVTRDASADLTKVPALTKDVSYIANVDTKYTAAATTSAKMEILSKELFISLFGNGTDAYNFYRRTGFPNNIQPNLEPTPGGFIRSFFYPSSETSSNSNVTQKANVTTRVFWDNNPTTGFPIGN